MKTIREKQLLVGADFAGYPLKEQQAMQREEYGCVRESRDEETYFPSESS